MTVNICIIAGNITRDPEVRYLPSGSAVVDFGVAVNKVWTTTDGEKREQVSFFNLVAFGKTAENINKYFFKGDPILVEGELKQETWDDKHTGEKKSAVKVIVNKFNFVGGKKKDGEERESSRGRSERKPAGRKSPIDDEDVPDRGAASAEADRPPEDYDVPF